MDIRSSVLSSSALADHAESVLVRYNQRRQLPVPMEEIIEFGLKLEIVPRRDLFKNARVDAFLTRDQRSIWVDYGQYMHNQPFLRFTFAEEVSHYLLHGAMLAKLELRTDSDWFQARRLLRLDPRFEWQAREMAGHLVVPRRELQREADRAFRMASATIQLRRDYALDAVTNLAVQTLARKFGVTEQVIEIRLDREGILQQWARSEQMVS